MLLILDDLHWADELTLGWLQFLLRGRQFEGNAILVMGTYRSDEVGPDLSKVLNSPRVHLLQLERLDRDAMGHMVGNMLGLSLPPEVFVSFLAEQCEGNPFFVAEYLRAALAKEVLVRNEVGRWEVAEREERTATREDYEALPPATIGVGAARRSVGQYAHKEAERLYRAFLGLVGEPTRESIAARIELGSEVLVLMGSMDEARAELEAALSEAREMRDRAAEAKSL